MCSYVLKPLFSRAPLYVRGFTTTLLPLSWRAMHIRSARSATAPSMSLRNVAFWRCQPYAYKHTIYKTTMDAAYEIQSNRVAWYSGAGEEVWGAAKTAKDTISRVVGWQGLFGGLWFNWNFRVQETRMGSARGFSRSSNQMLFGKRIRFSSKYNGVGVVSPWGLEYFLVQFR